MKLTAMLLGMTISGYAQVISVTAPSANQVTSGFQYNLTSSCSSCASLYSTEYDVDGELAGISRTPPYSFQWDTFYVGNGTHTIQAVARDSLNNTISKSTLVTFTVENNLPQQTCGTTCSDISVVQSFAATMSIPAGVAYTDNVIGLRGSAPAVVGTPAVNNSSNTIGLSVTTGNAVLAWVYLGNSAATVALSDGTNGAYTCQPTQRSSSATISSAFCYFLNASGGSLTLTATGGTGYVMYAIQVSGATSVNVSTGDAPSGGSSTFTSHGFMPNPTELVFYAAGYNNAANAATFGSLYTGLTQDPLKLSAVEYHSFANLNPFGTMSYAVTTNGVPSATKETYIYVDGFQAVLGVGSTSSPNTFTLDTTKFSNAAHQVVINQLNEANCVGCINGIWTWIGGWEQTLTFANGSVPMELRASATEIVLTPGGSSGNCTGGLSCVLTGTLVNTDGTSSAASISSCVSSNTAVFTIAGACTVTAVANGYATNTMTDSIGRTRTTGVYVLASNTVPHFESNGTVSNGNYDANSVYHNSLFFSGNVALNAFAPVYPASAFFADYSAAGFNTFEADSTGVGPAGPGVSEAAWDASVSAVITNVANIASAHKMHVHLISDSLFRGTPEMFQSQYGQCASFTTPCFQYAMQQWTNTGVVLGHSGVDEVSSAWGGTPLQGLAAGGMFLGSNGIGSITGNGTSCNLAWTVPALNGARTFLILNSGQSSLDFNPTTNTNLFSLGAGNNFTCSFNGTASSSTIRIEPYVAWPYNSSYQACSPGGAGSPPCPNYIKYDVFKKIRNQLTSITNFPGMTWPTPAGSTGFIGQWAGAISVTPSGSSTPIQMADYWEAYWSPTPIGYLPGKINLLSLYNNQVGSLYSQLPYIQLNAPVVEETAAEPTAYTWQGYQIPIASCSGSTITFSQPHNLFNVFVGVSRLWIPNSSGACNNGATTTLNGGISAGATSITVASAANFVVPTILVIDQEAYACYALASNTFSSCNPAIAGSQDQAHLNGAAVVGYIFNYITSAPTATTLKVASGVPTWNGTCCGAGGTALFDNGNSYTILAIGGNPGYQSGVGNVTLPTSSCPSDTFGNNLGHTFTLSGTSGGSYWSTNTFYLTLNLGKQCSESNNTIMQMETFASSTGGTATIVPDNNYVRGRSWQGNSDYDSADIFVSNILPLLTRTAGKRGYGWGETPQFFSFTGGWDSMAAQNNRVFMNYDLGGVAGGNQAQINGKWDYARTLEAWNAMANANLISSRLLKFVFQAEMPAPDYGRFFDATARTGPYGNLLMIQSLASGPVAVSANLAPYLVSGQQIVRECAGSQGVEAVAVLASGTTSDSFTYNPGEFCAYMFPVNTSAEYSPPVISALLADVTGATKIVVQFSYTTAAFLSSSVNAQLLLPTIDCGVGTCVLPVDPQIGPVSYRLLYLNASAKLLATSDVQTIGSSY
jgi:Big-like domain-containing protein